MREKDIENEGLIRLLDAKKSELECARSESKGLKEYYDKIVNKDKDRITLFERKIEQME